MKTVISLLTLAAIAIIHVLAVNLYLQNQLFFAYSFVLAAVVSFSFWISNNDILKSFKTA